MANVSTEVLRTLRVLIVEDDKPTRLLVRTFLEHLQFSDISEAEHAEEAIRELTRRNYDLVVSDLEMQPMDGWGLLDLIRHAPEVMNPYVPVILVTQHADKESVLRARDSGASAFVAKPVNFQNLQRTIMAVLSDKREFVKTEGYSGPDRRRREKFPKDGNYRRDEDFKW